MSAAPTAGAPIDSSTPGSIITTAVCDAHGVFRRRLLVALEAEDDIEVISEADVPGALGSIVGTLTPRVLAVDLAGPADGLPPAARADRSAEGIARLAAALPMTAILALAGPGDDPAMALLAGASGALTKTDALRRGREVVRTLAAGGLVVDRRAARSFAAMIDRDADNSGLNKHHLEVLHQVSSGRGLRELARFFRTDVGDLEHLLVEVVAVLRQEHPIGG